MWNKQSLWENRFLKNLYILPSDGNGGALGKKSIEQDNKDINDWQTVDSQMDFNCSSGLPSTDFDTQLSSKTSEQGYSSQTPGTDLDLEKNKSGEFQETDRDTTLSRNSKQVEEVLTSNEQQSLRLKGYEVEEQDGDENCQVSLKENEEKDNPVDVEDDLDLPDGGSRAWIVVFGSFMGLIPVFGMINSLGAIQSYVTKHQLKEVNPSAVAWIFSVYLALSFLSCVLAGSYFDRNGTRAPLYVGTVMYTGGLMATANCKTLWQFILSFSILSGTAAGILTTPLIGCVATWFLKKRAIATSIATIGGSIGGVVFPMLLRRLYDISGFQWAIRTLAFVCLFCLTCAIFFARERKRIKSDRFVSFPDAFKWYLTSSFGWRYFFEYKFLFLALGVAFTENSLTASANFTSYSMAQGNSQSESYTLYTTFNAIGILGRFIPAYLADKYFGAFNVMIATISIATLINFVMWLPFGNHLGVLWAYTLLYGFTTGTILSLAPACIGQISKTDDFGKRYSMAYLLESLLTLLILPMGGLIIGEGELKNYNHYIIFVSFLMVAGVICYSISRCLCVGLTISKF